MERQQLPNVVLEELNEDIATPHSSLRYPYVYLSEVKEVLGLIVPLLQPGELQIVVYSNNENREIGSVRKSILELNKLLRVCKFEIRTETEVYKISKVTDLFEIPEAIWTQ